MRCLKGYIRLMTKICFKKYGQICRGSAFNQEGKGVVLLSLLTLRLINPLNAMITIVRVNVEKRFLGIIPKCEGGKGWIQKLFLKLPDQSILDRRGPLFSQETSKFKSPKSKMLTEKFTLKSMRWVTILGYPPRN